MTAYRASNLKKIDYLVIRQGYQSSPTAYARDTNGNLIDLTDWTVTVSVEFYNSVFTQGEERSGDTIDFETLVPMLDNNGNPVLDEMGNQVPIPVKPLTVTKHPDQSAHIGEYNLFIPEDLYTGDIPLDTTNVIAGIVWHRFEWGPTPGQGQPDLREKRTEISFIVLRRGKPA